MTAGSAPSLFANLPERSVELVIDRLSKTYANGFHALKGVSLTIPTEMFGLLGSLYTSNTIAPVGDVSWNL